MEDIYQKYIQLYNEVKDLSPQEQKDKVRSYIGEIYKAFIKCTRDRNCNKEFEQAFYQLYGKLLVGDYSRQINNDIFANCMLAYAQQAKKGKIDRVFLTGFLQNGYLDEYIQNCEKQISNYLEGNNIKEKIKLQNNPDVYRLENISSYKIINGELPQEVTTYFLNEMLNPNSEISKKKDEYSLEREIIFKEYMLNVLGRDKYLK